MSNALAQSTSVRVHRGYSIVQSNLISMLHRCIFNYVDFWKTSCTSFGNSIYELSLTDLYVFIALFLRLSYHSHIYFFYPLVLLVRLHQWMLNFEPCGRHRYTHIHRYRQLSHSIDHVGLAPIINKIIMYTVTLLQGIPTTFMDVKCPTMDTLN